MKKLVFSAAALAAALAVAPAAAQAQDGPAASGAYVNVTGGLVDAGPSLWAVGGRIGYRVNAYVGVEGEAAFGVKSDDTTVSGVAVDVKLKHQLAAYAVGFLPVDEGTDLFARVGYGTSKIKASAAGVSASGSEESFNFGVGAQHHFDGVNGVRFDYTRYEFDGAGDADAWSISYSRKF